jgi:beta-glucosidase
MTAFVPPKGASPAEIEACVDAVLAEATLAEKVTMMSGQGFFEAFVQDNKVWGARPYRAGSGIERLGIEPLYFTDGPRGVARGQSTCFPCTMARGASFDPALEHRIGLAMAIEARAQGCTLSGAVCINLLRHPAWGRAQETYGEDSFHLGVMGAALGTGLQSHNVLATVKHFALNSMENARFKVDVTIDERTLHEIYLPHFKATLDAGVATVMSAYNQMNGEYCGQNRHLLTDILRGEWGFDGFVHSDWVMGVYKPYGAEAGLDVENPEPRVFGQALISAVETGQISPQVIDLACRRILSTQFRFAAMEDPLPAYPIELVASPAHVQLALEAAEKSAVLLENNGVLPFARGHVRRLAVLGKLAALENTGDFGSSRVRPPFVVTPLAGLIAALGEDAIVTGDEDDLAAATHAAAQADACVVVVGYTADEEGEFIPGDLTLGQEDAAAARPDAPKRRRPSRGGDRSSLELPAAQVALIEAAAASGKPVVVVVVAGSAVLVEAWRGKAAAILQTFYAGMEGGTALARLLFGEVSPAGRLPFTVAREASAYPYFDRDASAITYGYWHGYAKLLEEQVEPRYAFGHGLSYATFTHRALRARRTATAVSLSVAVRNDGAMTADEVVQVYVRYPGGITPRPARALAAFQRVTVAPGETAMVTLSVALDNLRYRCLITHSWKMEPGDYTFCVAPTAAADATLSAVVSL